MSLGRLFAARSASLVLAAALSPTLAACGGDDEPDRESASEVEVDDTEVEVDDQVSLSPPPVGAEVGEFCGVLGEIDTSIDRSRPGNDDDWLRLVDAFDALWETGTPDDFPVKGQQELVLADRLVRESSSVDEFTAAVEKRMPTGYGAVDQYARQHCTDQPVNER